MEQEEVVTVTHNEIGINTSELDPQELDELVKNNKELQEQNTSETNIEHEVKEEKTLPQRQVNQKSKKDLIAELEDKEKLEELLVKSNLELKNKIMTASTQYNEICLKLGLKENQEDEVSLQMKLKGLEKEIHAVCYETEHYKKLIESLKNKLEFKLNLEKAINLENLYKSEVARNKELRKEFDSLTKFNLIQIKAISNYDKENRVTEKIEILKHEIKSTKDGIKLFQDKLAKQDKFIKRIHEKISIIENMTKKLLIPKQEIAKNFTKDDLKRTLELLTNLKDQLKENQEKMKSIVKSNEEKLTNTNSTNMQIENEYKDNDKLNKMLIFKKNELKRLIKKNSSTLAKQIDKIDHKSSRIIDNNVEISHILHSSKKSF